MKRREELKELKAKPAEELKRLLAITREKLRELRFKVAQNQSKNVRELRVLKKKIAVILTLLKMKP